MSGQTYDDTCDAYYMNVGDSNPCTTGGAACAALNGTGGIATFCCYHPPSGSNCDFDYGTPQCIPE